MHRRPLSWLSIVAACASLVAAPGCDDDDPPPQPNGGAGGAGGAADVQQPFETGSATVEVFVPFDGCLTRAVQLETETGLAIDIEAGTCLTTTEGEEVTGDIELRVDGALDLLDEVNAGGTSPALGVIELSAGLITDGGVSPISLVLDPPAKADMSKLVQAYLPGYLRATHYSQDDGNNPYELVITGFMQMFTDKLSGGALEQVLIPVWGLVRTDWVPDYEAMASVTGDVIYEHCLGPIDQPYPAVYSVGLSSQIAQTFGYNFPLPLSQPGERWVWGDGKFESKIVERDGNRYFQTVTAVGNQFDVTIEICDSASAPMSSVSGSSTGSSANEADTAVAYVGQVKVTITGCGRWRDASDRLKQLRDILDTATGGDSRLRHQRVQVRNGEFEETAYLEGWNSSVQDIGPLLPAGWEVTYGDREITIHVPCPPAIPVTTQWDTFAVHTLDAAELTVDQTWGPVGGNPHELVQLGDNIYVASADTIDVIDATSGTSIDSFNVPGLTGALAAEPRGELLYAATSLGEFVTLDPTTGDIEWQISNLPLEPYIGMSVRADGSFAYLTTLGGQIWEIDLLRRQVPGGLDFIDPSPASVSNDGLTLAVAETTLHQVRLVDLRDLSEQIVPTSDPVTYAKWSEDDTTLLATSPTAGAVLQIDPASAAVLPVATGGGPSCLTTWTDDAGATHVLAGNFVEGSVHRYTLLGPTTAPTDGVTVAVHANVNLVRVPGH